MLDIQLQAEVDRRLAEKRRVLTEARDALFERVDRDGYAARPVDDVAGWGPALVICHPREPGFQMTLTAKRTDGRTYFEWCSAVARTEPADDLDRVMSFVKHWLPLG